MGGSYYRYEVILNLVGAENRIQYTKSTTFKIVANTV
jgi:hypothetical protein